MPIKHKKVVDAAMAADPIIHIDWEEWIDDHVVDVAAPSTLSGTEKDIAIQGQDGKTYYARVFEEKAVLNPPDPLNDLAWSIPLNSGYVHSTGEARSDIAKLTASFTGTTVDATRFAKADQGSLRLVVEPSIAMIPPPPQYTVGLSSLRSDGENPDVGQIRVDGVWFSLPTDMFPEEAGDYEVEFSHETLKFNMWVVTGDVLVDDTKKNPAVLTVVGDGTLKAIYKE